MNFDNFSSVKKLNLLVVGDVMLDHYLFGECRRISPEAPVPIIELREEKKMLGGAGNVVKNLTSFGVNCELLSIVGNDTSANDVLELLTNLNINKKSVFTDENRKTTVKTRIISSNQQLIRVDIESKFDISNYIEEQIIEYVSNNIQNYNAVLISDYLKGVITNNLCRQLISICKKHSIPVFVDPKGTNFDKYKNSNFIKPNLKELEIVSGVNLDSNEKIIHFSKKLKKELDLELLIVTMGEEGIFYLQNEYSFCKTDKTKVFDVSGAGDTVFASLAICLSLGYNIEESCCFANKAASIVIGEFGSSNTTIENVIKNLNKDESRN